jgi:Zn-dependent protease with chaperone function
VKSCAARYFDGQTASAHDVVAAFDGRTLTLSDARDAALARFPAADILPIDDGIAAVPTIFTSIAAPNARVILADAVVARLIIETLGLHHRHGRRIGASWRALGAWAAAAVAVGGIIYAVFPLLVGPITSLIPYAAEKQIGDTIMRGVIKRWPECRDPSGLAALEALTKRLQPKADIDRPYRFYVLSAPIENAFAAPGNHVVLFSGLIEKAGSPDEVAGVLGHEIGHQVMRHPMKHLVEAFGATFLLSAAFGGITPEAVTTWGAALYALKFSRDAEREADAIALDLTKDAGISSAGLVDFFRRIDESKDKLPSGMLGYLSTHPPTAERIAAIEKNGHQGMGSALDDAAWAALRNVCADQTPRQKDAQK